jgi:hypothetical protein
VARRIVVDGCNFAERVVATVPGGSAGFAVVVGSRRKVRPWVAAAASSRPHSTSAPARTPHIAHSQPVDRPRMKAAYCSFSLPSIQYWLSLMSHIACTPPT